MAGHQGGVIFGGLERRAGIEPASLAWKAKVLPLHKRRMQKSLIALNYNKSLALNTAAMLALMTG